MVFAQTRVRRNPKKENNRNRNEKERFLHTDSNYNYQYIVSFFDIAIFTEDCEQSHE